MSVAGTDLLNDYLQRRRMASALSWEETTSGPSHNPLWKAICKIDGKAYGVGMAKTKQQAKSKASLEARKALEALEEINAANAEGTSPSG